LSSQEIKFPISKIGSSEGGVTTIQQAYIGPIVVNQIKLNGFKGLFNYGSGVMKDTQMDIVIKPYIDYWWGICIDFGFDEYCYGDSGSVGLGNPLRLRGGPTVSARTSGFVPSRVALFSSWIL